MRKGQAIVPDFAKIWEKFGHAFSRTGSSDQLLAEACPWCGGSKLYMNAKTGQYDCKSGSCQQKGNLTTFLTWQFGQILERTTNDHYLALKAKRGIASQTLGLHELAYDEPNDRWLIPFKSSNRNVVNIQFYYPNKDKPNKFNLPGLPLSLYGFDKLVDPANKSKPVLLCEGVFDAIAVDYNLENNRSHYVVIASPGANFKPAWAEHFKGRKVRIPFDKDDGGRKGSERAGKLLMEAGAEQVKILKWPAVPPHIKDMNDLLRRVEIEEGCSEKSGIVEPRRIVGWIDEHCYEMLRESKLAWVHGADWAGKVKDKKDWVWPNHLPCGSYVSYAGGVGTLKSTILRELLARFTRGVPFPECTEPGLPAGHVIYVTAEDDHDTAMRSFEVAGADMSLIHVLPATLKDGDPMNILDHAVLGELRQGIRQHGARFVVIDGQNSVVGTPNISTDMQARSHVTNPLHQFAQKERICLVGIRNEDDDKRAYGPASMSHLGRAIMRSEELFPENATKWTGGKRYFKLVFVRISDVNPKLYPPIPYSVEDLSPEGQPTPDRKILWGTSPSPLTKALSDRDKVPLNGRPRKPYMKNPI
jgi:hypothetical protein